ncbi:MAG: penicillin-binding protein activator [Legionellales bacterium]|nr:penicillin-binding protein activator [Legionellales bacterium]
MKQVYHACLLILVFFITGCSPMSSALPSSQARGASNAIVPKQTPQKIALLLPLTGAVAGQARAVENGFFAAFYQAKTTSHTNANIDVIDTNGKNIVDVYQQAVQKGADVVVGPLLKNDVQALAASGKITVPTLALNAIDSAENNSLYEFSLSPEDEATQVASRAFSSGYRRALVIVPAGSWGAGISQAFANRWQALGGNVVDTLNINRNQVLSTAIRDFLKFNGSVRNENNSNVAPDHSTRRQDFDVVFMAVSPTAARQIKPLLNFYFAGNIPVYATSLIYSGVPNANGDKDLNGVIFADMPWAIQGKNLNQSSPRLYAFGEDAYALINQLSALANGSSITGETGQLYLAPNMQIQRVLSFGQFNQGIAQPSA